MLSFWGKLIRFFSVENRCHGGSLQFSFHLLVKVASDRMTMAERCNSSCNPIWESSLVDEELHKKDITLDGTPWLILMGTVNTYVQDNDNLILAG